MFGRKYQPEEIADQLHAVVRNGTIPLGAYERFVRPDDAERARLLLTAKVFPIAASFAVTVTSTKTDIKDALVQAHHIYLGRFPDQDQIVRAGDYVIWRIEREQLTRVLRDDFLQLIVPSALDTHEIRYGILLRIVSEIRKGMFLTDIEHGMSFFPGDPKQGLAIVFMSAGTTFTRHVLKIDPNDPFLTGSQRERFQTSVGFAAVFIGQSYFKMADVFKAMGA